MNPGYLSLLLTCMTIILMSSGWKEVFLSHVTHKEILLFFVFWIVSLQFTLTFYFFQINGSLLIICGLCLYILIRKVNWMKRIQIIVAGLLLGSLNFLLLEFFSLDPIFIVFRPGFDVAILLSLFFLLVKYDSNTQIASLSIGLILGDAYFAYIHRESLPITLGSALFQDKWWLAMVTVRMTTVIIQTFRISYRRFIHKYETFRKRGWK